MTVAGMGLRIDPRTSRSAEPENGRLPVASKENVSDSQSTILSAVYRFGAVLEERVRSTATRPECTTTTLATSEGILTEVLHFDSQRGGQFFDITEDVRELVGKSAVRHGQVTISTPHTTTTIAINEVETGFHNDFLATLDRVVPAEIYYEHDDHDLRTENLQEDEFINGHSHVRQMITGSSSLTVPVVDGELVLGQWQRVLYLELDQARARRAIVHVQGTTR